MEIAELLSVDRVRCEERASSKKRALEELSSLIATAQPGLAQTEVFESLIARERLGSTGLGHGVAIPHGRAKGGDRPVGAVLKLEEGVDFDALDGAPVTLLFAMLVPEESTEEHLTLLARLAEMFSDSALLAELAGANHPETIHHLLTTWRPAP